MRCSSAANTRAGSAPVAIARPAATAAFCTWKAPTSGSFTFISGAAMRDGDDLREAVDGAADQLDVVALLADRHDLEAAFLGGLDHLPGIAIVDIDHRRAVRRDQLLEQAQLGGEIGFDGLMIIEMIARQIGEGAGGDAHAVEPMLVEAVRRSFQRQMGDALAGQLIERAVQFDRIGRGERAVFFAPRRDHADGADAGGVKPERGPDLPREGGDRGLAAGAGDRGDGAGLAREKFRRRQGQRAARVAHRHENDSWRAVHPDAARRRPPRSLPPPLVWRNARRRLWRRRWRKTGSPL